MKQGEQGEKIALFSYKSLIYICLALETVFLGQNQLQFESCLFLGIGRQSPRIR